ncbi:hypothetical protein Scep_001528 [Stephania cephalantha]|uniref:Uncharacterized protein n=1 Tax=Stephania cephalantha TaxID=152367 RepID=A0AAP0L9K1_9MAGN
MAHADLVGSALNGLDAEYLPIITVLVKQVPIWPELHADLLSFEARLKQIQEVSNSLSSMIVNPSANAAFIKNQGFNNNIMIIKVAETMEAEVVLIEVEAEAIIAICVRYVDVLVML